MTWRRQSKSAKCFLQYIVLYNVQYVEKASGLNKRWHIFYALYDETAEKRNVGWRIVAFVCKLGILSFSICIQIWSAGYKLFSALSHNRLLQQLKEESSEISTPIFFYPSNLSRPLTNPG